jgi:nucleoside-diphosphate-sugar epimerase
MRLLLTGGSGNVGGYVSRELLKYKISHTITDLRAPSESAPGVTFVACDLMNLAQTREVVSDYDVVLHLAAIPNAFQDPPEHVMAVNMVTCYNVLEAVRHNGIKRIVYAGSESSTGFGIHDVVLKPQYLPIDEAHPLWPHESYSFTKRFGEEMAENYARAFGIEVISLRYCGVWMRQNLAEVTSILETPRRGEAVQHPWFGCYVAAQDVAQAVRLAAQYQFSGNESIPFEAFFITADKTFYAEPTLEAMKRIYGELPEVRDPEYYRLNPNAPAFDIRKAQRLLGYAPKKDWRTIEGWEEED